jgi:hypothetical protein
MKLTLAVAMLACACAAPTAGVRALSPDVTAKCVDTCKSMGLKMQAVVVVANRTGCVCEPSDTAPRASRSPVGAVEMIIAMEQDQAANELQEQQLQDAQQFQQYQLQTNR